MSIKYQLLFAICTFLIMYIIDVHIIICYMHILIINIDYIIIMSTLLACIITVCAFKITCINEKWYN